jgi:hypothetical protein
MPIAVRVSIVALPTCGKRKVFFSETYPGLSFGSPSYTSSPAAASRPLLSAAIRSSSATNPPRAVFTTMAPTGSSLSLWSSRCDGSEESPARAGSGTGSREADPPDPCGRRHRPRVRQVTHYCYNSESSFRIRALDALPLVPRAPFRRSRGPCLRVAIPGAHRGQGVFTLPFEPTPEPRKPDARRPAKATWRCRPSLH